MKLHRFGTTLPFVKPFIALITGITIAEATSIAVPFELVFVLLSASLVMHRLRRGSNSIVFIKSLAIFLTIVSAGMYLLHEASQQLALKAGNYQGSVYLNNDIRCTPDYCGTIADLHISNQNGEITTVRVRFSFPPDSTHQLVTGCQCRFEGTFKNYQTQRNPYSFDGARYALENGLAGRMIVSQYTCETKETSFRSHGRQALRSALAKIENPEVSALFYALLSGDKTDLSEVTRTSFARCGIMHLLAVSGLHVGLIAWAPLLLLRLTYRRVPRFTMALVVVALVWGFAWFTGLSASVTRASAMISLMAIGLAFRKKVSTLNSLAAVGIFMLVSAPRLLFNAGFLLSFSAVAAIVLWTPVITDRFFLRSPVKRYLMQSSAVAITAQAGTSPISVYYFKQLPLLFLPANLIAVPLATFTLYLLLVTLIIEAGGLSPTWLYTALNFLGQLLLLIASMISELPYAALESIEISLTEAMLWMLLTALIFRLWAHPSKPLRLIAYGVAYLLVGFVHFRQDHRTELLLFSSYGEPLIGLTSRSNAHLLVWDDRQRTFAAQGWQAYTGATICVLNEGLDTTLCHIPIRRQGDWLQIGHLLLSKKAYDGPIASKDQKITLGLASGQAALIAGQETETTLDLSEYALAVRINSDGTIGKWYDRRKPPNRLPLP